jgi:mannose-6-phosphate isomerase-like protein (cupin superfamily)
MDWLHRLGEVRGRMPAEPGAMPYVDALRHGSMRLGLYRPVGTDTQGPHKQDELYVVVSGQGGFIKSGERVEVAVHDVLFVEAGAEHRFVDFSDDFAVWVIFWGPEGGEKA